MLKYSGILCLLAMLFWSACSPERKLARNYVNHYKGSGIMIVPAYELYKDNLTISYDTAVQYSPEQFDSIAWAQSCFIRHVSDSAFLTAFTNSLINELTTKGFDVYVDGSSDVFLSLPDPKWVIQIAQLELDENHRIESREMYSVERGEQVEEEFRINQVSLKSWFDVSRANTDNKQVLYLEGYIQDDFHLFYDIDLMEGSLGLLQNRDSINLDNVYRMADESGQKHAGLLFDYFMNDYIRENLPSGIINRKYFHYDLSKKSLQLGLKERFDVVN